jgi:hypothetical protein
MKDYFKRFGFKSLLLGVVMGLVGFLAPSNSTTTEAHPSICFDSLTRGWKCVQNVDPVYTYCKSGYPDSYCEGGVVC